jgi:hypothetical protein
MDTTQRHESLTDGTYITAVSVVALLNDTLFIVDERRALGVSVVLGGDDSIYTVVCDAVVTLYDIQATLEESGAW